MEGGVVVRRRPLNTYTQQSPIKCWMVSLESWRLPATFSGPCHYSVTNKVYNNKLCAFLLLLLLSSEHRTQRIFLFSRNKDFYFKTKKKKRKRAGQHLLHICPPFTKWRRYKRAPKWKHSKILSLFVLMAVFKQHDTFFLGCSGSSSSQKSLSPWASLWHYISETTRYFSHRTSFKTESPLFIIFCLTRKQRRGNRKREERESPGP